MTNAATITAHAQQGLNKLAELLRNNPNIYADIEAHSDWRGTNDANNQLASQRLSAVKSSISTSRNAIQSITHYKLWRTV